MPKTYLFDFHPYAPVIKYFQHNKNTCVFSSLVYALFDSIEHVTEKDIAHQIESSVYCASLDYFDRIFFANKVMTDCVKENF